MKYSLPFAHVVDFDWGMFNYSLGQISMPSFVTSELLELPLISKKLKSYEHERDLNNEPFIPFCYLYNQSCSAKNGFGLKIFNFDPICYCSLFRPGKSINQLNLISMEK